MLYNCSLSNWWKINNFVDAIEEFRLKDFRSSPNTSSFFRRARLPFRALEAKGNAFLNHLRADIGRHDDHGYF